MLPREITFCQLWTNITEKTFSKKILTEVNQWQLFRTSGQFSRRTVPQNMHFEGILKVMTTSIRITLNYPETRKVLLVPFKVTQAFLITNNELNRSFVNFSWFETFHEKYLERKRISLRTTLIPLKFSTYFYLISSETLDQKWLRNIFRKKTGKLINQFQGSGH